MVNKLSNLNKLVEILSFIYKNPGVTVSDVKDNFNLPSSTASVFIKKLKDMKLVYSEEDFIDTYIKRKDTSFIRKVKVLRLYPSYVSCNKQGTVIVPNILQADGDDPVVGLTVYKCPFVHECPFVNKYTLVPGYCKLYNILTDEEKKNIRDMISKLEEFLKKYEQNKD